MGIFEDQGNLIVATIALEQSVEGEQGGFAGAMGDGDNVMVNGRWGMVDG